MTDTKHDRYLDLLDGQADAGSERMVGLLGALGQRFASASLPAARDGEIVRLLREGARASRKPVSLRAQGRGWRGLSLARRAALLAVASLTAIAVLTGATLAFGGPVFPWNYSFLQQFGQGPQAQTVNLASSACGYTLRVRRVYADANVFIIGYAFTKPDGQFVASGLLAPVVTDASGVTLPVSDYGGVASLGGATGTLQYQSFDTGGVQGQPTTLQLRVVIPALVLQHETPAPSPCVGPTSGAQVAADAGQSGDQGATPTPASSNPKDNTPAVHGPFTFDITVKYHGGRELQAPITVTAHGRTLTLERVVSTPLETRFSVSGSAMNAYPTLDMGGRTLNAGSWGPEGSLIVYRFPGSAYLDHGRWMLAIHSQHDGPPSQGAPPLPQGTWTFTFTLP